MSKKKNFIIIFKLFFFVIYSNLYSNDKHNELLNLLEYNYPAEFFFTQASKDSLSEGWMIIGGKGKARIEFTPPNNTLIIADGKWIIFHDPELDRATYLPLESGILQALLDPQSFQNKKSFLVRETKEDGKIVFNIEFNLEEKKQEVFIYFSEKNFTLLGWKIIESANKEIIVKISEIKKVTKEQLLKKNIFKFTEKMRKTGKAYYGPYKRKVNRIENNGRLN